MHKLTDAVSTITKAYGKTAGGLGFRFPSFARLPTGILTLDLALAGGIPMGAVSLIYGNESSGKTSLALRLAAQFQKRHGKGKNARKVVWLDVENAWDEEWVRLHGVDPDQVYLFRPTTAEEAADVADEVAMAQDAGLIIVDSIAAMSSIDQLEKSAEKVVVAGAAKPSTTLLRKIGAGITEHAKAGQTLTVIYINQPRMKIGFHMGNPEFLPGPVMQNFQAFLKLRLTGKAILKEKISPIPIYSDNTAKIVKKKFPCIRQSCEWQTMLYPWEHAGKKHWPLEVNNRTHAEALLEDLDYLSKSATVKGKWDLFDIEHPDAGELLQFPTKTAAVDWAVERYDALTKFLIDDLLLLYKDDIKKQLEEAEKAGHK